MSDEGHHIAVSARQGVCKCSTEQIEKKCGDILVARTSRIQTRKVM